MAQRESERALTVAERQKRFRKAQIEKKRLLEQQIRAAKHRLEEVSTVEMGEQIAVMANKWGDRHKSVRDRVLILARRLEIV